MAGLTPGERGTAALHLAAMVARSNGDDLAVVVVVPTPWPPNPYRADAEYLAVQEQQARRTLAEVADVVGPDLPVRCRLHRARSVSSGLLEVVAEEAASSVVLGSASSGLLGQVSLGGIADRILHSSEVPVTLAPAGFTAARGARIARVTVAYGRADRDSDLLRTARAVAERIGASLRVACFAVRPPDARGRSLEPGAEDLMVAEWRRAVVVEITDTAGAELETVVGQGGSWSEAVADVSWADGDVLAVGASSSPVSRFFLGSHASKILRNAPVPVTLVPRLVPAPA
ncbi:MAG: universal stress protein [Janthinobacterium lividum]